MRWDTLLSQFSVLVNRFLAYYWFELRILCICDLILLIGWIALLFSSWAAIIIELELRLTSEIQVHLFCLERKSIREDEEGEVFRPRRFKCQSEYQQPWETLFFASSLCAATSFCHCSFFWACPFTLQPISTMQLFMEKRLKVYTTYIVLFYACVSWCDTLVLYVVRLSDI